MTLSWTKPNGGFFRYVIVLFLLFWLCGWLFGLVSVVKQLLSDSGPNTFLLIWLCGWTVGGLFALATVYLLLRPQKPESITFGPYSLTYNTGSPALDFMNPYYMMRNKRNLPNPFSLLFRKAKQYEFTRGDCPEFLLEGLGDAQRLRFDDGAERVVIGEYLSEPEREWIAEVLTGWRKG